MKSLLDKLKKSWQLRFPYFRYEEYRYKVDNISQRAIKEEISKKRFRKIYLR